MNKKNLIYAGLSSLLILGSGCKEKNPPINNSERKSFQSTEDSIKKALTPSRYGSNEKNYLEIGDLFYKKEAFPVKVARLKSINSDNVTLITNGITFEHKYQILRFQGPNEEYCVISNQVLDLTENDLYTFEFWKLLPRQEMTQKNFFDGFIKNELYTFEGYQVPNVCYAPKKMLPNIQGVIRTKTLEHITKEVSQ